MSLVNRLLGAAVLAIASVATAHAAVITFEGLSGPAFNQQGFNEAGYNVSFVAPGNVPPNTVLIGRFIDGSDPASCGTSICPTDNPTTYLDLFNTGYVDIITAGTPGATFRFSSLDASFIASEDTTYPNFPAALQVIGFRADGTSTSIQFDIPNVIDFQTFNAADVDPSFAGQDFVEIAIVGFGCVQNGQCSGLDGTPGEIGLDNIVLSDLSPGSQVPEPATLSLLAFGLMGLGARMRRRH